MISVSTKMISIFNRREKIDFGTSIICELKSIDNIFVACILIFSIPYESDWSPRFGRISGFIHSLNHWFHVLFSLSFWFFLRNIHYVHLHSHTYYFAWRIKILAEFLRQINLPHCCFHQLNRTMPSVFICDLRTPDYSVHYSY